MEDMSAKGRRNCWFQSFGTGTAGEWSSASRKPPVKFYAGYQIIILHHNFYDHDTNDVQIIF
jgi:hypothetical protein